MSLPTSDLDLAADFEQATEAQWRALVNTALKGADFDQRLIARTADGVVLHPLYMPAKSGQPIIAGTAGRPWTIVQRMDHPEPAEANAMALADLEGGSGALTIVAPDAGTAFGYGVRLSTIDDVDRALNGIALDMITLRLDPATSGKALAALIAAYVARAGVAAATVNINFGLDPIATLMRQGALGATWPEVEQDLAATVGALRKHGFAGSLVVCDMRPIHQAGGSEVQELGAALAVGVAYLKALSANGFALEQATAALSWVIAVDGDQFLNLAKLRALRRLWARVEQASGLTTRPIKVHAETAWRMMSRRDPAVNMLRATMATATASIAGADSIQVLPHTLALGLPNQFARRVARNIQTVLAEESNLWRVADPAAGSGAYEALTNELCERAWAAFQDIEREGGIVESLCAGKLQARVAAVRTARNQGIARRKIALTGTSAFPNLTEREETVLDVARPLAQTSSEQYSSDVTIPFADMITRFADGAMIRNLSSPSSARITAPALPSHRLSEPYEALRDSADRHTAARGARPTVFLANLGTLADYGVRATWIRNLLAAGGIDASGDDGFTNAADVGHAFADSPATVACICGTDETYAQLAHAVAARLKQAGARRIYVAGRAGDHEHRLRAAGVDEFLFAGADVLDALANLHSALDIAS